MIGAFLFRFEKVQIFEMEIFSKAMVVYLYTTIVWYLPWLVHVEIYSLPYRYIDGSIGSKENWQSNLTINHLIEIINVKDITFIFSLLSLFLSYFLFFYIHFLEMNGMPIEDAWTILDTTALKKAHTTWILQEPYATTWASIQRILPTSSNILLVEPRSVVIATV